MKRRQLIRQMSMLSGAMFLTQKGIAVANQSMERSAEASLLHSVCKWCYRDIPLESLCESAQDIGLKSIELLGPKDWPLLKKYNLTCAVGNDSFISLTNGLNQPELHSKHQSGYISLLQKAADHGIPNVICFSGNRNGLDDDKGLENCARGLDPIVKEAEKLGVTVIMELLNSKVNHKDYQCDHTEWGVSLAEKIGSPNFKLLYDIYHMQIMEGDIIATIKKYHTYIAHYHTGGVPGRNEIDESQELYYPAIVRAIQESGFKGFIAQEFIPSKKDVLESLRQGVQICSV